MMHMPSELEAATEAEIASGPDRLRLQGERFAYLLTYRPSGLEAVADAVRAYSRESGTVLDFVLVAEVVQHFLQRRASPSA